MKKLLLGISAFALILCSCSSRSDRTSAYDGVIDSIVDTMSTRQKVAQLLFMDIFPKQDSAAMARQDSILRTEQLGGIIMMDGTLSDAVERLNQVQSLVSLPLTVSVDGEFGLGMRIKEFRKFPRQAYLSQLPNSKYLYEIGQAVAKEMKSMKININFAPCIDVNVNPDNIVVGTRSFGPDKNLVAEYGSAYAMGMQDGGIIACAKHFPGHGDTSVDSHKGMPVLTFDRSRIDDLELFPFRRLIRDGVDMVMIGHLCVTAIDSLPASVSPKVIQGVLREELGFEGLVVTDALNMRGVLDMYDSSSSLATLAAYKAGVDILLMPDDIVGAIDAIVSYIGEDPEKISDLNSRVRRLLRVKANAGMLDSGYDRMIDIASVDTLMSRSLQLKIESMITIDE
ncbi:MAG: hypothetical protein MJZ16_10810 [Bacteroidales bacterium]|nr:hypothetical protein [Bacteroidales bacterium]